MEKNISVSHSTTNLYEIIENIRNQLLQKSISQMIKYDQDIIIYPGHGPKTTLKEEINNLISYL